MHYDFSSVDSFWPIVDALSRDVEPGEDTWASLFRTPGYRALTASEFSRDFFRECWRLAFQPSMQMEDPPPRRARYIEHYRKVLARKDEIVAFLQKCKRSHSLYDRAVEMAMEHLPPADYRDHPRLAFVVFDMDGRGYQPIVVDPLSAMASGDGLVYFLAHEFHHHYVGELTGLRPGSSQYTYSDLEWVVDQIHREGLANMVNWEADSRRGVHSEAYLEALRRAPEYLRFMDSRLQAVQERGDTIEDIGGELRRNLAYSGHPVGYYMARTIRDNLGRASLLECTHDPLVFFLTFAEAERKAGLKQTLTLESQGMLGANYRTSPDTVP